MIVAICPKCRCRLEAPETLANRRLKCPQCQAVFAVPNPTISSTPPSAVAAAPTIESVSQVETPLAFDPSRGWRFLSSPWIVMTFVFGFLPWCEVSCNSREIDAHLSQSGYQGLYGGVSAPPAMEEMLAKESEQRNLSQSVNESREGLHKQLGIERSYLANVSPFLVFFWAANLALLGIICFVPLGSWRLGFALPLCGVLLGVLILHACLGLPLERRVGQVIGQAMREAPPSDRMFLLAAFKSGKTVWFWLTLACVVLLAMTEPLLNWLRAERWGGWIVPGSITAGAAALMLVAVIVQFAMREALVSGMENRMAQLRQAEEEKRRQAVAEQRQREEEHRAEIQRRAVEAERLRQQAAMKAEEARLLEQRRLRELEEEERRRQKEREQEELRVLLEKRKREAEARRKAEQDAKEEAEREAARKAELEKKGLPYYPRPRTVYNGRTADEWSRQAQTDTVAALAALEALQEEGMPFLLDLLQKQKTVEGRKAVLTRIHGSNIHPYDLRKLLPCLERKKDLERNRDFVKTRMLALRCLHQRAEHLKDLVPKMEDRVKDLRITSIYKDEIKKILDDIHEKTK